MTQLFMSRRPQCQHKNNALTMSEQQALRNATASSRKAPAANGINGARQRTASTSVDRSDESEIRPADSASNAPGPRARGSYERRVERTHTTTTETTRRRVRAPGQDGRPDGADNRQPSSKDSRSSANQQVKPSSNREEAKKVLRMGMCS